MLCVQALLDIELLLIECFLVILLSVIINLAAFFFKKKIKFLMRESFLFLLFDTTQLGVLLYLNGGILNPFAILILASVIISATYLKFYWTVFIHVFNTTNNSYQIFYTTKLEKRFYNSCTIQ